MSPEIDLSGLKDIIEPMRPPIFPLAPGWWLVILAGVIGVLALVWLMAKRYFSPLQYALREWAALRNDATLPAPFAKEGSKLLKRAAIFKFGAQKVAGLSDQAWARFLQAKAKQNTDPAITKFIAFSPYLPDNAKEAVRIDDLYDTVRGLLKSILKEKRHERQ